MKPSVLTSNHSDLRKTLKRKLYFFGFVFIYPEAVFQKEQRAGLRTGKVRFVSHLWIAQFQKYPLMSQCPQANLYYKKL